MEGLDVEKPYVDPQFEYLFERIHPARVCVDNDSCKNCTVVKVDSVNTHGILLEMVQVLSDLDLVISKSYICSDGGWFMDVFYITDKSGSKVTDESVILYIQQAISATRRKLKQTLQVCPGKDLMPSHVSTSGTALEITSSDKPGLLSELCAVLDDLGCHVTSTVLWTHNSRAACIIYVEKNKPGPITNVAFLKNLQRQMQNVVKAHHDTGEKWDVRLMEPLTGEIHTERRLHQLMLRDMEDYEKCRGCGASSVGEIGQQINKLHGINCYSTLVSIETWKEKDYSVVNVTCGDRPKLLFDTVCALTDMDFDVFHAAIRSHLSIAFQEYYIRHRDGNILSSEDKKHKVVHCLIAAVERRAAQGLQLDISAANQAGLLRDITRVLRECGVSVSKAEVSLKGEKAAGTFYIRGASGQTLNCREIIKSLQDEAAAKVTTPSLDISSLVPESRSASTDRIVEEKPALISIGDLIWSQLENLSTSLIPIGI